MNMPHDLARRLGRTAGALALIASPLGAWAANDDHTPAEILGTWRGTSTCVDLVAAPACKDEVVIYDFTPGPKPGTVRWNADKVVDGRRQPMGELEAAYDASRKCWAAEFKSPRSHSVWCVVVEGAHLTGTARQLPGERTTRKVDARKD